MLNDLGQILKAGYSNNKIWAPIMIVAFIFELVVTKSFIVSPWLVAVLFFFVAIVEIITLISGKKNQKIMNWWAQENPEQARIAWTSLRISHSMAIAFLVISYFTLKITNPLVATIITSVWWLVYLIYHITRVYYDNYAHESQMGFLNYVEEKIKEAIKEKKNEK